MQRAKDSFRDGGKPTRFRRHVCHVKTTFSRFHHVHYKWYTWRLESATEKSKVFPPRDLLKQLAIKVMDHS